MYLDRAEDKQEHPWQWITAFSQPPRACSAHDRPCFMNGVDALHSLLEKHGESYMELVPVPTHCFPVVCLTLWAVVSSS